MFLMLSELSSVSTDFRESPSVSVGIYFSLISLYRGQLNKKWYSLSIFVFCFFTESTVLIDCVSRLISFINSNFTYSQPQFY